MLTLKRSYYTRLCLNGQQSAFLVSNDESKCGMTLFSPLLGKYVRFGLVWFGWVD